MKKVLFLAAAAMLFTLAGCNDCSDRMTDDYPANYDVHYGLRQVVQYDPMNIDGIDVGPKLDFFSTLRFTIHYTDGAISAASFTNGDIPFSPFGFDVPEGRFECEFDDFAIPNELRIAGTDNVIAYFQNGEFSIPFQLDHSSISYKYTFKGVESN
ncbi:MAG: hypothetical protein LBV38_01155 [Alistipes sp.]|jgi:hypothetical protein|nr:hypothetical protein [Alistipes sp.]